MSEHEAGGLGTPPYQGYEFQIDGTVWLALYLMLKAGLADGLIIEPASGEDVEADLNVQPEQALSSVRVDSLRTDFQLKMRGIQWTAAALRDVLKGKSGNSSDRKSRKGPPPRVRPAERLRKRSADRFILITDAQLHSALHGLIITLPEESPSKTALPDAGIPEEIAGRVGVLDRRVAERLALEVNDILRERAYVPASQLLSCREALRQEIRSRLLGRSAPLWSLQQLKRLIEQFGGFPSLPTEPVFVPPTSYPNLRDQLQARNALLLTGPPGTGKTLVAEHLAHEQVLAGFELVRNPSPGAIRTALKSSVPQLFFLEDPWGHYKLRPEAELWAAELPKLLNGTSVAKRFLITSRAGVMHQALGSQSPVELQNIDISLSAEHYTAELRQRILSENMWDARPWQRDFAELNRNEIVQRLRSPLSLAKFAIRLKQAAKKDASKWKEWLDASEIEAIGHELAKEVEGRGAGAVASALVIWAAAMTGLPLRHGTVADLRRRLVATGYRGFQGGVAPENVLSWLIRTRALVPKGDDHIAHPTTLQGLELLIDEHPDTAEEILNAFLTAHVSSAEVVTAHQLIKILHGRNLPIPVTVQRAIDEHLLAKARESDGSEFREIFSELAEFASGKDPVSHLAKLLSTRRHDPNWRFFSPWVLPKLDEPSKCAIAGSPEARALAAQFVTSGVISRGSTRYQPADLLAFFTELGWDLSAEFIAAARTAIEEGHEDAEVPLAAALLTVRPPYEDFLGLALGAVADAEKWHEKHVDEYERAMQGELDATYSRYLYDEAPERFGPPRKALEMIVAACRRTEGFAWIMAHPSRAELLDAWAEAIDGSTTTEELNALKSACVGASLRPFWRAVTKALRPEFLLAVLDGVIEVSLEELPECLKCLRALCASDWEQVLPELLRLPLSRRGDVAWAWQTLRRKQLEPDEDASPLRRADDFQQAILSPAEQESFQLCVSADQPDPGRIRGATEPTLVTLRTLAASAGDELGIRAVFTLSLVEEDLSSYLERFARSKDWQIRFNALRLCRFASDEGLRRLFVTAIAEDPEHLCRNALLEELSQRPDDVSKSIVFSRAEKDASGVVRETCARIIGQHQWPEGLATLVKLLSDRRDMGDSMLRGGSPIYHVARAAAMAIDGYADLPASIIEAILRFVQDRDPQNDDSVVHYHLINALADQRDERLLQLFTGLLSDQWCVHGARRDAYPLRYAGAWAVFEQLLHGGTPSDSAIEALLYAAKHDDARLAAPCLACLAALGRRAREALRSALAVHSEEAAWLAGFAATLAGVDDAEHVKAATEDHPSTRITKLAVGEPHDGEDRLRAFLATDSEATAWLQRIRSKADLHPPIRFLLLRLFGTQSLLGLTDSDHRDTDLADAIGVLSTWSMAGGR